jgi:hypothetical protein
MHRSLLVARFGDINEFMAHSDLMNSKALSERDRQGKTEVTPAHIYDKTSEVSGRCAAPYDRRGVCCEWRGMA